MTIANAMGRARARALRTTFQLLYTRLGFLHEPVGRAVFGAAWDGRRRSILPESLSGCLLDLGCGEGRLLGTLDRHSCSGFGIDPSPVMARRANDRGIDVVVATAQALPLRNGCARHVVVTYPGPWIVNPGVWDEIVRVTVAGATINILLGGDISRGRGSSARALLIRLAYGGQHKATGELPRLGHSLVIGEYESVEDHWGIAMRWRGVQR